MEWERGVEGIKERGKKEGRRREGREKEGKASIEMKAP